GGGWAAVSHRAGALLRAAGGERRVPAAARRARGPAARGYPRHGDPPDDGTGAELACAGRAREDRDATRVPRAAEARAERVLARGVPAAPARLLPRRRALGGRVDRRYPGLRRESNGHRPDAD